MLVEQLKVILELIFSGDLEKRAFEYAGRMKEKGKMYILMPKK